MPIPLYNAETGKPESVDLDSAHKGIEDGTLTPQKTQEVQVVLADGRRGSVQGHELREAMANGARLVDPEGEAHEKLVQEQEGLRGTYNAAATHVLSGALGGMGTGLIRQGLTSVSPTAGKRWEDTIRAQEEAHPYVSTGSEMAGAALAAAATKGESVGAEALTPAAAIDGIGAVAEHGVAKAVAGLGGRGLGAVTARSAAATAARAGVESALFSAGQHVGEDQLGDHDTAADKLFVATAKGGAFGLGLGGVLGGAGSLVRGMRGAASKGGSAILGEVAAEGAATAEAKLAAAEKAHAEATARLGVAEKAHADVPVALTAPQGIEGMSPAAAEEMRLRSAEDPVVTARREATRADLATARSDYEAATKDADAARHLETLSKAIKSDDPHHIADKLTWEATGADAGLTKRVNKFPGGVERAGATMRKYGVLELSEGEGLIKSVGNSLGENTPEKMLARTESTLSKLVEEMHGIGGTQTHATLGELLAPLDAQIAKLEKVSSTVPVANQLRAQRQMLLGTPKFRSLLDVDGNLVPGAEKSPVSLSDIIAERRGVNRKAYAVGDVHATTIKESNAELGAAWDKLEQQALDKVAPGEGGKFKALKTDITDLINVEKALEGRVARASSARAFGVLPHMMGLAGSAIGGAVLPVAGHAVGHGIGLMLGKMGMDRGRAAAAVALTKVADIGAVKHLMGTVDASISKAAKGLTKVSEGPKPRLVSGSGRAPRESKIEPLNDRYRGAVAKLDAMENAQSPIHERAMAATQDLAQHAPNVANSFALAMSRAAAYLSSKRPVPLVPASPYLNQEPSILQTDKLSFVKAFEAGTNPQGVLDRFAEGTVTYEDVDALRNCAPKVYEQLHTEVMKEVADMHAAKKGMPFKQRQQLAMLFPDLDVEPAFEPSTYKILQGNVFQPPPPPPKPKGGAHGNGPSRPVKLPSTTNPLDRLMMK